MAVNPNEDTEFNDALRKHGIIPVRERTPPTPPTPPSPTLDDLLTEYTPNELKELSEGANDDEMERVISAYRRERIEEDRRDDKRARFGRVYPIGREEYTREVTEASLIDEEGDDDEKGTGVICFLYKDGIPHSDLTSHHIQTLATRYPRSKFVSIIGDKCIPNLPDARIPMIIIYRKGEIRNQLVAWGADRPRRIEELEALLIVASAVQLPDRPPQGSQRNNNRTEDEDSDFDLDDDDDLSSRMRSIGATLTNVRAPKNIRGSSKKEPEADDDSDFEFDL